MFVSVKSLTALIDQDIQFYRVFSTVKDDKPDTFRLFVVRFACFGGRAPCCRFAFCKSPAACLRYKKNKRMFLPCRICSGLVWM